MKGGESTLGKVAIIWTKTGKEDGQQRAEVTQRSHKMKHQVEKEPKRREMNS